MRTLFVAFFVVLVCASKFGLGFRCLSFSFTSVKLISPKLSPKTLLFPLSATVSDKQESANLQPNMESEPTLKIISPEDVKADKIDPVDPGARDQAAEIINDVRENGEEALLKRSIALGDIAEADKDKYTLGPEELKKAFDSLTEEQQGVLRRAAGRIRAFALCQKAALTPAELPLPGGVGGHTISPMAAAGCYAPGGRYPLPSSVLMTAVTARAAGVKTVWVASPKPTQVTLGAAHVAGADGMLCLGGAQAIAALAYGIGRVPQCDIIVGPGNKWVTAAKSLVGGVCAIDMLAGPSEVLVIADDTADPDVVAADLLAQAEHDVEARPILVSTSTDLIEKTNQRLQARLADLPTAPTARVAVTKGFAVKVSTAEEAVAVTDMIGPEHLQIEVEKRQEMADRISNYGAVFLGRYSTEVLGDYGAGPNHVLPTCGTAKYTGGLSVLSFLRVRTYLRIDRGEDEEYQQMVKDSVALARMEGLEAHARSAECRLLENMEPDAKRQKS
mmetsp:Transcript_8543/g.13084  ORF Transcript_8543/g.13084 Transcript_8543/m.13084 type:complete len:503 (-) Transcript_8543:178-1686(-)